MKLPEFTAEVSIYKSKGIYFMVPSQIPNEGRTYLQPQRFPPVPMGLNEMDIMRKTVPPTSTIFIVDSHCLNQCLHDQRIRRSFCPEKCAAYYGGLASPSDCITRCERGESVFLPDRPPLPPDRTLHPFYCLKCLRPYHSLNGREVGIIDLGILRLVF